jgi:superfamily II DNA or RNA helicase
LADEVGLGKTLEVGSIVRYLRDLGQIKSSLFLAPKNVVLQLQAEFSEKFGLEFLVWNSSKQRYVNSQGEQETSDFGPPGSASAPDWIIVSSQWARGSSSRDHIFEQMQRVPDLLVVDEAHAARVAPPENKVAPSRLFSALMRASEIIPHVILMTATPMQIHVSEYHGLLTILGLPETWRKLRNFELALTHQANPRQALTLNDAKTIALMAGEAIAQTPNSDHGALKSIPALDSENLVSGATYIRRAWSDSVKDFIRLNPATQLTVRNTRSSLERFGYKFPERNFLEPEITMPRQMSAIKLSLDTYLSSAYGKVEELLSIDGKGVSRGFVTSIYEQRFASSLSSLQSSLVRRKEKLEALFFDRFIDLEFDDDDLLDDESESAEFIQSAPKGITESVKSAIQNEVNYLEDVLAQIDSVTLGPIEGDSKLLAAKEIIKNKISANQRTIVFSRYTDTISALVKTIESDERFEGVPFGLYTGKDCWISEGSGKHELTKSQLQSSLANGRIMFVICSDAASEGINLQSASVLVNVDVPWNPGRLEQRIGRIARLGQKAPSVEIANLWYPNSVEATMYGRLLERKELYDLAVGAFPELFAKGIREMVSMQSGNRMSYSGDVLEKLEELREESHLKGLAMLWDETMTQVSKSASIWSEWDRVSQVIGLPVRSETGMLFDGLIDLTSNFEAPNTNASLYAYANQFGTWDLKLHMDQGNRIIKFSASDLPRLIQLIFGKALEFEMSVFGNGEEWLPDHSQFSSIFSGESQVGEYPQGLNLEQIEIGRLKVNHED